MTNIRKRAAPGKRRYDSSRRQTQARKTKLEIAEAARRLFLERGYAGATIEAIAELAGVATETVYSVFENKRNLLAFVMDTSLAGDDQPVPIIERPEPQAILADTDQRRQIAGFATGITEILERAAAVFDVMRIAGRTEPEIANRVERMLDERLRNMGQVAQRLAANGPLRPGLDEPSAAEILWTLSSHDVYLLTTGYLKWNKERYRQWLIETLTRLLLP